MQATLNVYVTIQDVLENWAPSGIVPLRGIAFSENLPINSVILEFNGTDTQEIPSPIPWCQEKGDHNSYFDINATSGLVSTNRIFDYELKSTTIRSVFGLRTKMENLMSNPLCSNWKIGTILITHKSSLLFPRRFFWT